MEQFLRITNEKLEHYHFTDEEIAELWGIISEIFLHPEFQRRLDNKVYSHHGCTSLGEHILTDAIVTYRLATKSKVRIDKRLAVIIAMLHDLYEEPWQNNPRKEKRFSNKHGFIHPIEAAINACFFFPEYFTNTYDAKIIIDGIIHHMFPFPVRVFDETDLELHNEHKFNELNDELKELILATTKRGTLGHLSYARSKWNEGRIITKADKIATIRGDKLSIYGYLALISGYNHELKKKK